MLRSPLRSMTSEATSTVQVPVFQAFCLQQSAEERMDGWRSLLSSPANLQLQVYGQRGKIELMGQEETSSQEVSGSTENTAILSGLQDRNRRWERALTCGTIQVCSPTWETLSSFCNGHLSVNPRRAEPRLSHLCPGSTQARLCVSS